MYTHVYVYAYKFVHVYIYAYVYKLSSSFLVCNILQAAKNFFMPLPQLDCDDILSSRAF